MTDPVAGPASTRDTLRGAIAAMLEIDADAVGDNDDLHQLGMDSLQLMRLVNQWRREGVRVSSRTLAAEPTLGAWARHIDELRAALRLETDA